MNLPTPRWIERLLDWYCEPLLVEGILGDLDEKFYLNLETRGRRMARLLYVLQGLGFLQLKFRKKRSNSNIEPMLKNNLTITLRNLSKHPFYAFINTLGLAIGMAAGFMILQYVHYELGYDKFFENKENIYRVQTNRYQDGELATQWAAGAAGVGLHMKEDLPEVIEFVNLASSQAQISYDNKYYQPESPYYAGEEFFEVFSLPLIAGVDSLVLKEPFTVALSESLARKIFGDENPMGQIISQNDSRDFKVTGIFQDFPGQSHMNFDLLYSFETYAVLTSQEAKTAWQWDGFLNYVVLAPGTDPDQLALKFPDFIEAREGETLREFNSDMEFILQPLADIHLISDYRSEIKSNGNKQSTYFLLIIGMFVLFIAWINYINLTTARSMNRAKEVGIRKVMGSNRAQLLRQFLFESFFLNLMAFLIAAVAVVISFPFFNNFVGRSSAYTFPTDAIFWLGIGLVFLVGIVLSGFYPAVVLSRFRPVAVLKGRFSGSASGNLLRKGLVVFQFLASLVLITGTFIVYQQMSFLQSQDLGVRVDQTMVVSPPSFATDSIFEIRNTTFQNRLNGEANVSGFAVSTSVPGRTPNWNAGGIRFVGESDSESNQYRVLGCDDQFMDFYGVDLITGRKFSSSFGNEDANVIFNEAAMQRIGIADPEDLINRKLFFWGDTFNIIGVVKNYRQESPKQAYDAIIFRYFDSPGGYYSIDINTSDLKHSITRIEESWEEAFGAKPFDFFFLDDYYNEQYAGDVKFGSIFSLFSGLAIFVAVLGLFGLSSFITALRTKEIGIRKVLGANIQALWLLLTQSFIKLVLLALAISVPLTWYIMTGWLDNFETRIGLSWYLFGIPAVSLLVMTVFTVSYHTLKTAVLNPALTLKDE